jgi:TP901-1 family phage major tail protein
MTAFSGTLVLIKIGNGATTEVFTTIGGLRTSEMTINHQALDATNIESGLWRKLQGSSGILSMSITGSGLFTGASSEETLRGYVFTGATANYQFIFANGSYITGPFIITRYQRSGDYNEEEVYSISAQSAGTLIFSAS